jgi:hypothetical protein
MQCRYIGEAKIFDSHTLKLTEPTDMQIGEKVKLTIESETTARKPRIFGCVKDWMEISPDFDEPLEDMKEYME